MVSEARQERTGSRKGPVGAVCLPEVLQGGWGGWQGAQTTAPIVDPVVQLQEAQLRAALFQAQPQLLHVAPAVVHSAGAPGPDTADKGAVLEPGPGPAGTPGAPSVLTPAGLVQSRPTFPSRCGQHSPSQCHSRRC